MAQLSHHPSIVTIYHAAIAADGRPFLVMEYCSRPGLAERYRQERISVAEALRIGIRLASAVETAHRAGILHRDIKPANVLTTDFGWPALTDFGIAATTGSRRGCDGRHVDPVVAARAARRAPDGRRALGRVLAGGDDLLAARRPDPVRDRRRAEHRAAAGRPHRAGAAAADGSRRRARGPAGRCSSAPWPSTRRAGSPPRRPSRARCSRSRRTCGCRSPRSTSWTRPTPGPGRDAAGAVAGRRTGRTRPGCARSSASPRRRPSRPRPSRRRRRVPTSRRGCAGSTDRRARAREPLVPARCSSRRAEVVRRRARDRSSAGGRAWWPASSSGLVVLAAVVAIGAVALRGDGSPTTARRRRADFTQDAAPDADHRRRPVAAGLQGTRQADGSVVFTWENPEPQEGDRYLWGVLQATGEPEPRAGRRRRR